MAKDNELFIKKANENTWRKAGEINFPKYKNISRMAYSTELEKLVVVMERVED